MMVVLSGARRAMLALVFAVAPLSQAAAQSVPAPGAAPQSVLVPPAGVDSVLDARVKTVASRLRCPVCQGESIQDSPAELSAQMRSLVREQLANGRTESQVFDYFVQKYGQWILLEPRAEGINLLVYWLPIIFLVLGGVGLMMAVKKWTRPAAIPE
ncbi:MAG: cytochrome c-type biogenesis protein [Gemmatimonadaceae bacterium]